MPTWEQATEGRQGPYRGRLPDTVSLKDVLAHGAYQGLWHALMPLHLARLWWRGRREPGYRLALGERFGFYGSTAHPADVWLHAVSLGETRAAAPLIDALRAARPGLRLLLTHATATGREAGSNLLTEGDRQAWFPVDTPGAWRRFFRHFRPGVGVLIETEVWPALMQEAAVQRLPMVLASARLSERSLRRGRRFERLLRPAARRLTLTLAQSGADAARLEEMGASPVEVAGNLKYDLQPAALLLQRGRDWRAAGSRPCVLAAVTREGEEALLLASWRAESGRLLIVPRHPQRFDEVAGLVRSRGLTLSRRSRWPAGQPDAEALAADVWLGDTLGEMPAYYAAADVALLGGSFEPLGGQNLIEAAACGCPLVMGPSTYNFAQAADWAVEQGAAIRTSGMPQALETVQQLLADDSRRERMAQAAQASCAVHRGAAGRMAARILALLDDRG